jgi:hypothetical protein
MDQFVRSFPDLYVDTRYPIQFGSGDWMTVVAPTPRCRGDSPDSPNGNAASGRFEDRLELVELASYAAADLVA